MIALRILRIVHHKCGCPSVGRVIAMKWYLGVLGVRGSRFQGVEAIQRGSCLSLPSDRIVGSGDSKAYRC